MSEWETSPDFATQHLRSSSPSWWLQTAVVVGALLMGSGGAIALFHPAMLAPPGNEINGAVQVYAGYFAARNLTLAILLLVVICLRARQTLNAMLLVVGFIQLFDAALDIVEGRWFLVPGVTILAVLFLVGASRLSGSPFWKIGAWKESR
jgi:hypothetical protein